MSADGHLQPLQFRFEHESALGYPDREHALYAYEGDIRDPQNFRGMMSWHPKTGEIGYIRTEDGYRKRGVGTQLLGRAQEEARSRGLAHPVHSDDLTDDGRSFTAKRPL